MAGAEHSAIRRYFPILGIAGLCLSRVCQPPYFVDAVIAEDQGRFSIRKTDDTGGWVISEEFFVEKDPVAALGQAATLLRGLETDALPYDGNRLREELKIVAW